MVHGEAAPKLIHDDLQAHELLLPVLAEAERNCLENGKAILRRPWRRLVAKKVELERTRLVFRGSVHPIRVCLEDLPVGSRHGGKGGGGLP